MRRWRPSLRMAWRDLRRHKGRSLLTLVLVMLPVLVATVAATIVHNERYEGERVAREVMGAADATVEVTKFEAVKITFADSWAATRPARFTRDAGGKRVPIRRPATAIDLAALLPEGSRLVPQPTYRSRTLASGGFAQLRVVEADDPMTIGLHPTLEQGRAPVAADEAAVQQETAAALGMLDGEGQLRDDARVTFGDGSSLGVVGLTQPDEYANETQILVSHAAVAARRAPTGWLVDLPDLGRQDTKALISDLADHGVAMLPRDVFYHPGEWGVRDRPGPVDAQALGIGALVILLGLIEVVLIVGSAFAVGARRQIRDLGLLAATGGAPADVRRALLAQGLVVGATGAVLGVGTGVAAFYASLPFYEQLRHTTFWTRDLDWSALVLIAVLGAATGIAAALIPAWSIGRLTPVQALSGRFAVSTSESTAHRGAFWLTGLGVVTLALSGVWLSREFAPKPLDAPPASGLPIALGGLGALLLVAGVVWMAPYAVRRIAELGRLLPLTARHAFRDAARHRFRTAAAAVGLTVTTAALVIGTFAVASAAGIEDRERLLPPRSVMTYADMVSPHPTAAIAADLTATLGSVLGPVTIYTAQAYAPGRSGYLDVSMKAARRTFGVRVVDERTLAWLVGPDDVEAALATYRAGGVVTRRSFGAGEEAQIKVESGRRRDNRTFAVAAIRVTATEVDGFMDAWISPATAVAHGLEPQPSSILSISEREITSDDLAALRVRGIEAWSPDPAQTRSRWLMAAVLGAAGLLTALMAGIAVALAAAEGRNDMATLAAIGASPRRRRMLGAGHGLFLGITGTVLGLVIGVPAGLSLTQLDGLEGVHLPWLGFVATLVLVPFVAAVAGWVVTPTKLVLVRRGG